MSPPACRAAAITSNRHKGRSHLLPKEALQALAHAKDTAQKTHLAKWEPPGFLDVLSLTTGPYASDSPGPSLPAVFR